MKPKTPSSISRRQVLSRAATGGAALWLSAMAGGTRGKDFASQKVVVGVMGCSRNSIGGDGRGTGLAALLGSLPGAEVAYVCDVDSRNVPKAIEAVTKKQAKPPKGVGDFRRILDDPDVDALVIATPDHWHAPATILGCSAGKHVYCEKPASHNAQEGFWSIEAARKNKRVVQLGTQRRSWPGMQEAVAKLRDGAIGRILSAKTFYYANRPTIGTGKPAAVPEWLDWSLWQGLAPEKEFRDNFVHYNWHWFWHWGTAELGNNGVHMLDVARWGLGVEYPSRVSCSGLKLRYPEDDQETPDTATACFDFDGCTLTWEGRSWMSKATTDPDYELAFFGEKGSLLIRGGGYAICDPRGKEIAKGAGPGGDQVHLQNFIDAIRKGDKLNAEIAEGVKSTHLCSIGNIAWRTGRTVHLDPSTGRIKDDPAAQALWGREYRKGWEPKV